MMNHSTLKIRISHHSDTAMGPGKADLLDAINQCGSISSAAKQMGMSYRRAWELVDAMNHCFSQPLVSTHPGGGKLSGAQVTELGLHVLNSYRALMNKTQALCKQELEDITRYLSPID